MAINPETLPLGGGAPVSRSHTTSYMVAALGALLFCSALLNVAQFAQNRPGYQAISLGDSFNRVEEPRAVVANSALGRPYCDSGLVLKCVDEASIGSAAAAVVPEPAQPTPVQPAAAASSTPGENAVLPSVGVAKYCRKDTWLLSCLFYKADINDELTDWKSVKTECDREALCDGVNKYWTSDLWHISSSGEAPGCDPNLRDGNGTDASAFYKEGSKGWNLFKGDGSCREVDEWGNPATGASLA